MDTSWAIRVAEQADLPAMTRLYGLFARDGYATFDVQGLPESVWEHRLASTDAGDVMLVALEPSAGLLGFCWSHAYRDKAAYASTRETTIYVDPAAAGQGLGTALYADLLRRVAAAGVHLVVAGIAEPNPASTSLHERLGFTRVGTMSEVGNKHGTYRDVTWWQRRLDQRIGS